MKKTLSILLAIVSIMSIFSISSTSFAKEETQSKRIISVIYENVITKNYNDPETYTQYIKANTENNKTAYLKIERGSKIKLKVVYKGTNKKVPSKYYKIEYPSTKTFGICHAYVTLKGDGLKKCKFNEKDSIKKMTANYIITPKRPKKIKVNVLSGKKISAKKFAKLYPGVRLNPNGTYVYVSMTKDPKCGWSQVQFSSKSGKKYAATSKTGEFYIPVTDISLTKDIKNGYAFNGVNLSKKDRNLIGENAVNSSRAKNFPNVKI